MEIIILGDSAIPLYEQIVNQLKDQILQGKLEQGSILPSIRALAKELKVSIITVKRAYEELELEGFVETTPGKGTYVSMDNRERLREIRISQIEEKLEEVVTSVKNIGMDLEDLIERITLIYGEV
ncbi:MAG: GntR family transcriptional regulator [Candidatus Cellulosilyticum pullistercoris]|uniref:GntR family transcriptional regulator n=1 Tax=Candidatus Cellulosilyticum pullistercoris TaxID=2838521 RepID=A0A9E2NLF1_9FIRM|nr:GntR family transcriptional regulator [Candidatus Cellulosilyticum pullistercoris]